MEWISVKDRMPLEHVKVQVLDMGSFHHIATYEDCLLEDDYKHKLQFNPDVMQVSGWEWEVNGFEDITHWAPLLELPR